MEEYKAAMLTEVYRLRAELTEQQQQQQEEEEEEGFEDNDAVCANVEQRNNPDASTEITPFREDEVKKLWARYGEALRCASEELCQEEDVARREAEEAAAKQMTALAECRAATRVQAEKNRALAELRRLRDENATLRQELACRDGKSCSDPSQIGAHQ